jgi:hypothetical protein
MRTHPRLPTLLTLLALLAARPLASQTSSVATPPVPATRGVWFDAGALVEDQVRFGVDAVPLGRVTFGLAIGYSQTTHPRDDFFPPPYVYNAADGALLPSCDPRMLSLCAYPPYPYGYGEPSHYRAWTFDLSARYYPAALSFRNGGARMLVYGGAHVSYQWRTWEEQPWSYYCPAGYLCAMVPVPEAGTPVASPADSLVPLPQYPILPWVSPVRHTLKGLEPGLEVGVRLLPAGPLFLEVGGRFTLVVVDDRMQRRLPGDVDARLVLAGGLAW